MAGFPRADLDDLARAKRTLEHPSLAFHLAASVGLPIEALVKRLPDAVQRAIAEGTRRALTASLQVAIRTLDSDRRGPASNWLHRGVVMATGAAGGAAGLAGLAIELPVSTTLMLRSIADLARAEGEDLSSVATRLECLTVFAYGSPSPADDATDSAYFAMRAALARAVVQAAQHLSERAFAEAVSERATPALVQLVGQIAQRFSVSVADKAAAQLVPLIGAVGGAAVNALFMNHFQDVAKAHFTVRRLERWHGSEPVRVTYERIQDERR